MLLKLTHDEGSQIRSLPEWLNRGKLNTQTRLELELEYAARRNFRVEIVTVENVVSTYNQFYRELRPINKGR